MKFELRILFSLFLLLAVSLTSCTRAVNNSSNVELTLPTSKPVVNLQKTVSKLNGKNVLRTLEIPGYANLAHVVINVQGPGIPSTILCGYNVEKETNYGPCDFSAFPVVKIEVPSGPDRLFQMALAYSSSDTGSMSLNYGDSIRSLGAGSTAQVDIPLREVSANSQQGHLKGRYLTGPNQGPSGVLEVKVKPDSGRPSLTIMKTEIFSGWFEAFSMSGLKFEYVVNGNQVLFNEAVEKSYFENLAANSSQVRLISGGDGYEVFGFFGDEPSIAQKVASQTTCTAATVFESCIASDTRFMGPFRSTDSQGSMLALSQNSISWALLPGAENFITDFRLLYNANASPETDPEFKKRFFREENLKDCNYLESYSGTQVLAGSIPVSQNSFSAQFPAFTENALLALCPRLGPVSFQSALTYPEFSNSDGDDQSPYVSLQISGTNGMNPVLTIGECNIADFKLTRSTGPNSAEEYFAVGTVTLSNLNNPASGGTWVQFYTDSGCQNQFTGSATIDAANTYQNETLYAKAIMTGTGLAVNPTVQSSDPNETIVVYPQHNTFSVNQPLLAANGPQKMIVTSGGPPTIQQMCYKIIISRLSASGQEVGFGLPGIDVNFNLNGDYTAYSSAADCEANTSGFGSGPIEILPDDPSVEIFVKRVNATTSDLPIIFSASNYQSVSHSVTGSNNSKIGSRFQISQVGVHQIGMCNAIKISHVNKDGDEIPVSDPFVEFPVKSEMEVKLTEDPHCSPGADITDKVAFFEGEHTKYLYYFGYANFNHTIAITNGALTGQSGSISIVPPNDPQQPFLLMNLPKIKSPILGSHEFPKSISLIPSGGATVECYMANQPYTYGTFDTPCSTFDPNSNSLSWTAADASQATMKGFMFRVTSAGNRFAEYYFIPERLYSFVHPSSSIPFDVKACDVTLTADPTTGWNQINGNISTVLCLGAGVFSGGTAAAKSLGSNKVIIGATSATGSPATTFQAGPNVSAITASGTGGISTVANISFVSAASGTPAPLVDMASSTTKLESLNNEFTTTANHPYGFLKSNSSAELLSINDNFKLNGSSSSASGVKINSYSATATTTIILNPKFEFQSSGSISIARGVHIYQSNAHIEMNGAQITPGLNNGALIATEQSSQTATIYLSNSDLRFSGGSNLNRFPFMLQNGVTSFNMDNVKIVSDMPQNILKASVASAAELSLNISKSRFISEQDVSAIFISSTGVQNVILEDTHFIRRLSVGVGSSAISGSASHLVNTPVSYTPQGVLFCAASAPVQWASAFGFALNGSSTLSGYSLNLNYDVTTDSCY